MRDKSAPYAKAGRRALFWSSILAFLFAAALLGNSVFASDDGPAAESLPVAKGLLDADVNSYLCTSLVKESPTKAILGRSPTMMIAYLKWIPIEGGAKRWSLEIKTAKNREGVSIELKDFDAKDEGEMHQRARLFVRPHGEGASVVLFYFNDADTLQGLAYNVDKDGDKITTDEGFKVLDRGFTHDVPDSMISLWSIVDGAEEGFYTAHECIKIDGEEGLVERCLSSDPCFTIDSYCVYDPVERQIQRFKLPPSILSSGRQDYTPDRVYTAVNRQFYSEGIGENKSRRLKWVDEKVGETATICYEYNAEDHEYYLNAYDIAWSPKDASTTSELTTTSSDAGSGGTSPSTSAASATTTNVNTGSGSSTSGSRTKQSQASPPTGTSTIGTGVVSGNTSSSSVPTGDRSGTGVDTMSSQPAGYESVAPSLAIGVTEPSRDCPDFGLLGIAEICAIVVAIILAFLLLVYVACDIRSTFAGDSEDGEPPQRGNDAGADDEDEETDQ
jgi:hypothetical protein